MNRTSTVLALAALMATAGCADLTEHPVTGVASDYFQSLAGANAAALVEAMKSAYPTAGLPIALEIGAKVNKGEMKW